MSRAPVTDPNHVPFTYVTEAVSYTVRDGGLVEMAFAAEHAGDPDADEPPPRVVEARLAMPLVAAASLAEILGRIAAQQLSERGEASAPDPAAVSHGVIVAGLDFVVRELLDHSVAEADRGPLLDWLRDRLGRELQRADIEGVAVAEGPAVEHAVRVLDQMFRRWQPASEPSAG